MAERGALEAFRVGEVVHYKNEPFAPVHATVIKVWGETVDIRLIGKMNHEGTAPCDRHVWLDELSREPFDG